MENEEYIRHVASVLKVGEGRGIKFLFNAILFNNFYILPKVGGDGVDNVDVGEFDLRFFENLFKENDRDFRLLEIHVYYS